ncbi:MAG: hypothetical protein IPJ27_13840 [Candidatus Accumulibacter sp.]|uniref:CRISPR-associated protein n=1 Tax=Candidatus Accumulibacter proximus TaxID=2954385 RepID=A0A935UHH6_9PROT|nr:hypothetical protein [Candidatus Accumulibacter proximus]
MKSGKQDVQNAAINITLAFVILLLQSWIADGIKGDQLFPWLPGGALIFGAAESGWCLLGMGLLSVGCAGVLYARRRSFVPVTVQRIGQPGRVEPHAVLVLTVSWPGWQWESGQLTRTDPNTTKQESHALPATLPAVLDVMAALGQREKFAWEQLLRAIREHLPRLQRVILIGSSGTNGTAASFDACRQMIAHYFPGLVQASIQARTASFEALDDLLGVYRKIIVEEAQRKGDVMIDVTGGTKVVSIAAAMVTLEHPEIEFQYVETEGEKRVRTFNVISGSAGGEGP